MRDKQLEEAGLENVSQATNEAEPEEKAEKPLEEAKPKKETKTDSRATARPSVPPPSIGYAPGNDQKTEEITNPTTPEIEADSEPAPEPVSWLQRLRFWDMANRIIAQRNGEPAEFDEAELKEFATALRRVQGFHDHLFKLQETLRERAAFAKSEYFDEQILASLRGENSLPTGTRDRSKKFSALQFDQVNKENGWAKHIESKLIRDQVTKGDLLQLSLQLREQLMLFLALREAEIVLDEFFLSFPWEHSPNADLGKIQGWYPNVMQTTPRELWVDTPPKWFKEDHPKLSKLNVVVARPYERPQEPRVNTLLSVMDNSQFRELIVLADRFEELSGGGDLLLIFPEIGDLPMRDRVVEASRRNLTAVKEADAAAVQALRMAVYDQLDEEGRERLVRVKNANPNTLSFGVSHYLLNLDFDTSDFAVVAIIDDAVEKQQGLSIFYERSMPKRGDLYKIVRDKRREVFDTGAKWYFGHSE